jgi:hypothetical protein
VYGTAESRIFHRTPAGHTADKKTRRKRNRGCYGLLSIPRQPFSPLPSPTSRVCRTACGYVIRISWRKAPPPSHTPPPPPTHSPWQKCVIFRVSGQKWGWPLFTGPKVMQLNSDSFCDHVQIWMAVIGHLWAELGFWSFPEKGLKYSRPRTFDRTQIFRQVVPVQQAGTVRQRRRPYKLSGSESRSHLRTAWRRGNTIWERALQPDWEGVRSWRFCRAQIVRVWTPIFSGAYIFYRPRRFQRPPCYCRILCDANILDEAQIFYICADILDRHKCHGRKYFMGANISIGANISWVQIFHGSNISMGEIFWGVHTLLIGSEYFVCKLLFGQVPIFNDFCSQFCQFYFAMSFCLIFAANICVYFQYLFMDVVCANIFGANVLKSRFKIDVVIMITCSIVIIINSVLTLQVSTAKYPMIADLAK